MTIKLNYKDSHVTINSLGAELVDFHHKDKNYIWTIDEKFWNKTSPVLFPIVGRLKNDEYQLHDKKFNLPRHGFARNHEFEIHQIDESSAIFSLKENEETLTYYPFHFDFSIQYTLIKNKLEIEYIVKNNSETQMPFSIGAHPAFSIDGDFNDYSLAFDNDEMLTSHELEKENFTGKTTSITLQNKVLPLSYSLFETDAIVLKKFNSKKITIIKKNIPYLAVELNGFPNLGIWTKPQAPFLCIEPWHGYADNTNSSGKILEKEGILLLNKHEVFSASFSITIL